MPRNGWKTVAIRESIYKLLERRAKNNRRSVSAELEVILEGVGIKQEVKT